MKQRILIKIGGRAFTDKTGFQELAQAIQSLQAEIILLHGGGAEISQALKEARRETVFVDGVRITQKEDIEIVEKVLSGTVNERIAYWLEEFGVTCRRLSGKSESLMIAEKTQRNGRDIGYVGEIVAVNPQVILETLATGRVPIVSPISATVEGITLNVNADTAAAALAIGANCTDLVYFSDVPGVMDAQKMIMADLPIATAAEMIRSGVITGGMIAKLESIFAAVRDGVERVHITQWQGSETLNRLIHGGEIIKTTIHE
jgi:acetylglutamate kinase